MQDIEAAAGAPSGSRGPRGPVVIVGAGHAGVGVAAALREHGFDGRIVLVGDERHIPYQRPPLSKDMLWGAERDDAPPLRPASFYAERGLELVLGDAATGLDRAGRRVSLASGRVLPYDHLVLATGARSAGLAGGPPPPGVHALRTLEEARALRLALQGPGRLVVVGAGFIGLEGAAAAVKLGWDVTVFEAADRAMARLVSAGTAAAIQRRHEANGVAFRFGSPVTGWRIAHGRVAGVQVPGDTVPADLVLLGVGATPNVGLARAAGLRIERGIVVDTFLRTEDPAISAVGDCAAYPLPEGPAALESVQAASDGARCVAERLAGRPRPLDAVPWFWSDQGEAKLQIAGFGRGHDREVARGDVHGPGFSMFLYRAERLVAVESVNRPAEHAMARRILAAGRHPRAEQVADPAVPLRAMLQD